MKGDKSGQSPVRRVTLSFSLHKLRTPIFRCFGKNQEGHTDHIEILKHIEFQYGGSKMQDLRLHGTLEKILDAARAILKY